MTCKKHLHFLIVCFVVPILASVSVSFATVLPERPNIVLIFTDDQGYSDIGCFGAIGFKTPHLDKLAEEGRRFTNFCVPVSVCTPSRAALLTGCYPQRVLNGFDASSVFFPSHAPNIGPGKFGLNPNETTMADLLKEQGYATCIVGKWHLGDAPQFLPTKQGFDEYFGIPYSNDMGHRDAKGELRETQIRPPLPLYDGETIIETEPDQRFLTRHYTERAIDFIKRNKEKPFFLYVPHTMPHVPLAVHPDFAGKSDHGLYGDVIQELDWSVGEIVQTIKENGLEEKTMIVYTSDNGPWLHLGDLGGHAEPFRDGKFNRYEGGHRVPSIMYWKGQIKQGTVASDLLGSIDLMPTFAKLAGTTMPQDRKTDGIEAWDYISGETDVSPRQTYIFGERVIRHGKWKLFKSGQFGESVQRDRFNSNDEWRDAMKTLGTPNPFTSPRLYDLDADPGESQDVSNHHPEIVTKLEQLLQDFNQEMKTEARPVGHREESQ